MRQLWVGRLQEGGEDEAMLEALITVLLVNGQVQMRCVTDNVNGASACTPLSITITPGDLVEPMIENVLVDYEKLVCFGNTAT